MIKKSVTYTDFFTEEEQTDELYFNVTKSEIIENFEIISDFEKLQDKFGDASKSMRQPTPDEMRELLAFFKRIISMSYGIRPEGTNRFVKTEEALEDFLGSAAYDAFLWGMFDEPTSMMNFIMGIFPKEFASKDEVQKIKAQAEAQLKMLNASESVNEALPEFVAVPPLQDDEFTTKMREESTEPTRAELEAEVARLRAQSSSDA